MLNTDHYVALYAAYAVAMVGVLAAMRVMPAAWPLFRAPKFEHPWREFGYALIAAVGVIGVGQLYQAGVRLPTGGWLGPVLESVNQLFIFSPMLLLLVIRRQSPATAWLPRLSVGVHLLTGVVLAAAAVLVFTLVRAGAAAWPTVMLRLPAYANLDKLAQVFLEDVAIAILLVRLGVALKRPILAPAIVALLFAAGHIPAMFDEGATSAELARLLLDFGIGAFVLLTVQRTGSIWWFVWVHFAMDMMQFEHISMPAA